MTTPALPTFQPLPESYLQSQDDLVAGTRDSFIQGYDRTVELGNQLLDLNHRDARIESELTTSDEPEAVEFRRLVQTRDERIAQMDEAIEAKKAEALAKIEATVESPNLPQEVIGNLFDKARRSVMDYVDAKVFPSIAEALGKEFSIPTKSQLIGGTVHKSGSESSYKPRFDHAVYNGQNYATTAALAKALGVNTVEYVANAILVANGGRRIAPGEHTWNLRINDRDYQVQVFGNEPKTEAGTDAGSENTEAQQAA